MAIEKVLKLSSGKKEQIDPAVDTIAGKAFSFLGLSTFLAEKVGDILGFRKPDFSDAPSFNANGTINFVEWFNGATQITSQRRARVDFTYDVNLDPATEVWKIYDTNGTTILRTVTYTYTFVANVLTKTVEVTT